METRPYILIKLVLIVGPWRTRTRDVRRNSHFPDEAQKTKQRVILPDPIIKPNPA